MFTTLLRILYHLYYNRYYLYYVYYIFPVIETKHFALYDSIQNIIIIVSE